MRICDKILARKPSFSFEFFPPKTQEDTKTLYQSIKELRELGPDFVSVTNPASSVGALKTAAIALLIKEKFGLEPMAHFTCIAHSRRDITAICSELKRAGISNVLALRGDMPKDIDPDHKPEFNHADDLVGEIRTAGGFCIGVAGYPEKHPEAPSLAADIENLKRKLDRGASFVITQLFFNNDSYFSFVEQCRKAGITAPIVPGLMPVTSGKQLKRFAEMCGTRIPPAMTGKMALIQDDGKAVTEYGIQYGLDQARGLLKGGAPGIHFYTLNKSVSSREILRRLKAEGF